MCDSFGNTTPFHTCSKQSSFASLAANKSVAFSVKFLQDAMLHGSLNASGDLVRRAISADAARDAAAEVLAQHESVQWRLVVQTAGDS